MTTNLNNNYLRVLMKVVTFDPYFHLVLRDKDSWSMHHLPSPHLPSLHPTLSQSCHQQAVSPHLPEKLNLHRVHWSHSAELCNSTLEKSLLLLDHSQNKIKAFPIQFCQLQELIHLKLDDNELIQLPFKKKQFCKMCFLSAAHTKLPFSLSLYLSLFSEDLEKATS